MSIQDSISNVIKTAEQEVKTVERVGNQVKYNDEFYGYHVKDKDKYKYHWCAVFVWWVFKKTGNLGALQNLKSARVANYWQLLKSKEIKRSSDIQPGDLVFIWYSGSNPNHIGIVTSAADSSGVFHTIEGNTSKPGSGGSERNGDGVYRKTHKLGTKCKVARPFYDGSSVSSGGAVTDTFPLASGWVFAKGGIQFYNGRDGRFNAHIKAIQKQLNSSGYSLDVDGIFGAATHDAVVSFQSSHGLDADGKVGTNTWNALFASSSLKSTPGSWIQDEKGWWFKRTDGSYPKAEWEPIGGKWYYFNEEGYILQNCTSWIDNKLYAFNGDGALIIGKGTFDTDSDGVIYAIY